MNAPKSILSARALAKAKDWARKERLLPETLSDVVAHSLENNRAFRKYAATLLAEELKTALSQEYISQREAYRRFGSRNVKRWVQTCRILPQERGDSNRVWYDQAMLIQLSKEVYD